MSKVSESVGSKNLADLVLVTFVDGTVSLGGVTVGRSCLGGGTFIVFAADSFADSFAELITFETAVGFETDCFLTGVFVIDCFLTGVFAEIVFETDCFLTGFFIDADFETDRFLTVTAAAADFGSTFNGALCFGLNGLFTGLCAPVSILLFVVDFFLDCTICNLS